MPFGIGAPELIVVLAILLLLFGAKKLPELSRSLGQSIKEVRNGFTDDTASTKKEADTKDDANKPA